MKTSEKSIAEKLLKVKAVKLQPNNPFVWASGWNSPIYCDNRKTLSYPAIRNYIKVELVRTIINLYPDVEVIAGVATGAIAQGALVADTMGLEPLADKFRAFGFTVREMDARNFDEILDTFAQAPEPGKPTFIISHSHKGHPISFMSDNVAWHHHVHTEAEIDGILAELEAAK